MGEVFDVAVIGGGVVGCAVARRFTLEGARTILLERGADILSGASKGNSAILHTGFDAPAGSIELACMKAGRAEYLEIRERLGLPLLETGALLVAWNEAEAAKLAEIRAQAHANGIAEVSAVSREDLLRLEPHLSETAVAGLRIAGEHVIDPWSAPLAYLTQALANGAEIRRRAHVSGGRFDGSAWMLDVTGGTVAARHVVNCAGLFGDEVDRAMLGHAGFEIRPRKGQFIVYDKPAAKLASHVILPVPNERTKGVVICRTVFGNLLVGPTAEDQKSRTDASVTRDVLESLRRRGEEILPALAGMPVTATYSGLRPATERKDYRIEAHAGRNWITCAGIRSTGLTAALGIASHVFRLYGRPHRPVAEPACPRMPNLAEISPRDWQQPGYGRIVCHCEMVTEREIAASFGSPLPPGDLGGLKRRTRAMMGRCQGFYCSAEVAHLADGQIDAPLTVGAAHAA